MISRDKAAKYIDVVLRVLEVVDELAGDKLFPAEVALAGIKAALASIEDDKIEHLDPDDIRGIATRLRKDLAARDAAKDQALKDRFDITDIDKATD
ncbi:MAG TPA: hypothetical protein VF183_04700 [Acidimicrobiales bacterium]